MQKKTKLEVGPQLPKLPQRAVRIDGFRDLLETLRTLHADPKVIEAAERVLRERDSKPGV